MTTSYWVHPLSQKTADFASDVVIIGAGYLGLSTAYWLTELYPQIKVSVIDRSTVGSGASGRNAGFLTMGSAAFYRHLTQKWGKPKAKEIYAFAKESIDLASVHLGLENPTTSLTWIDRAWDDFDPTEFGFKKTLVGFENGPEYRVNPVRILEGLRAKLMGRGVRIVENISAFKIHARGISTELNEIHTPRVLLALNGYLPQFHGTFRDAIVPRRAQMLAVKLRAPLENTHLNYDPAERVYWRKEGSDTLVIGGKRLLDESGEVGDFEKISGLVQAGLEGYLRDKLRLDFEVIRRWSGTMAFTEHELPYLETVSAPVHTVVSGGYSGHGMGFGFKAGKELALLLAQEKTESFFSFASKGGFVL